MAGKLGISTGIATAVGLGAIIGAGIFALSGTAIATAGANALFAFLLVGIVAILVALEVGELVSIFPNAKGAAYSYVYNAFGSELGFITGVISFFSYSTAISVISLSFGAYFSSAFGMSSAIYSIPIAIVLICSLAIVNLFGIKKATASDTVLVVIKSCVLLIFVGFAVFFAFHSGGIRLSNFSIGPGQGGFAAIFTASVVIFFAYSGFQTISTFASRIKGGQLSAVKAIIYAVLISIVLYVLVIVALLVLMPASMYTVNADPLSVALKSVGAPTWLFLLIDFGALIATASAALANTLSSSRILYQISEDGLLPTVLRKYNKRNDVAVNGTILSAAVGIIMLFSGNVLIMAAISNFGLLFAYLMISLAVIHFRKVGKKGGFSAPFYPYLQVIAIIALLAFMYGMPRESLIIGVLLILSLLVIYYSLREVKSKKVVRIRLFGNRSLK